jgi:hypothetical protein
MKKERAKRIKIGIIFQLNIRLLKSPTFDFTGKWKIP